VQQEAKNRGGENADLVRL